MEREKDTELTIPSREIGGISKKHKPYIDSPLNYIFVSNGIYILHSSFNKYEWRDGMLKILRIDRGEYPSILL